MNKLLILLVTFLNLHALDAFITPDELKKSLTNDNLIILDVGTSALYKQSHIQNAIHVDASKFSEIDEIQELITELGIDSNSDLVIYSHNTDKGVLNSSYLALALIINGFERVSILDGGYMAWIFEYELLTSTEITTAQKDGNYTISKNSNILVDLHYVKQNLFKKTILDSRSPTHYFGTSRSKNVERIGHILSASSSYYKNNFLTDGTLREKGELDDIYIDGHEINKNDEVIVYGTDIYEASMNWYVLYKHMKIQNTKIYKASLIEWGNMQELPMKRFKWE